MLRWIVFGFLGLAGLVVVVLLVGWSLPIGHRASRSVELRAAPDVVFKAINDFPRMVEWRADVTRVEVTGEPGPGQLVREFGSNGEIPYRIEIVEPPRRLRTRIESTGMAFGGTWTYELAPTASGGTAITITEDGEVYNVLFRFMARFVFGYETTLASYLRDLVRKVGEG